MDLDFAADLAFQVIDEVGLVDQGWSFEFDNAERRFGACHFDRKVISLSASLTELNDREVVMETVLHECAHAIAGYDEAHGYGFVMAARKLGISGDACVPIGKAVSRTPSWAGTCPNCHRVARRVWRLSKKAQGSSCGPCCNEFNHGSYTSRFQLQWARVDK